MFDAPCSCRPQTGEAEQTIFETIFETLGRDKGKEPNGATIRDGPLGFGVQQNAPAPARRGGHGPSAKAFPPASDLFAAGHAKCKH